MVIQQNSFDAYQYVMRSISKSQRRVFECILKCQPITDKEIADRLRKPINTVTPRRGELVKLGLIEKDGNAVDLFTNCKSSKWVVKKQIG